MRKGGRESSPFFSCFHDAFRFAALEFAQAREGHASQGALMADLVHLSSVFSALRAIGVFKTKETILFLRRTVDFSPPNIGTRNLPGSVGSVWPAELSNEPIRGK